MNESSMKWNPAAVLRAVVCILMLSAAYVLQTSLGLRITVFGTHIDLLPSIVAAAGVVMGSGTGLVCGLAAGILYDVSGTGVEGLYPLYYMIWGISCGCLGTQFRRRETLCTALAAVAMVVLLAMLRYLFYMQFASASLSVFLSRVIWQGMLTAACSVPVLWLVRRLCGKRQKPEETPEI